MAYEDDIKNSLKSQVLNQWKQLGATNIGGGISLEDRAQGLAERLYANQITDLSKIGMGYGTGPMAQAMINRATAINKFGNALRKTTPSEEAAARLQETVNRLSNKTPYLTYDGRQIGFLGDIGTGENWQPTGYLQPGNLASWGAQGEGAVSYTVQQAPNGQVYFIPSWGSTSDLGSIAPILSIGASLLAPGIGSALASTLGTSAAVGSALAGGLIGGTLSEATGGDFLKGAISGGLGAAAAPISGGISEAVGGGMLGSALGQGLTSAGLAELQGGDAGQALLTGAVMGAANYVPPAQGMNSPLTPAQIESGLGTEGYGTGAAAQESGLFTTPPSINVDYSITPPVSSPIIPDMGAQGLQPPVEPIIPDIGAQGLLTPDVSISLIPDMGAQGIIVPPAYTPPVEYIPEVSTVGSGAYTQTSYPIDMAELAAADAMQLMNQGVGIPAVEQNLVASGLDPLIAADLTQQISLDPTLTSNDLANKLISTYGSNIYDTTIDQINEAAPKSTEQPALPTSTDINWGALAKGLMGLLAANQAAQAVPSVQAPITGTSFRPTDTMPVYSPEYFQQIQQYYNTYLPSTPRDVATPLEQWYSNGYVEPDSVTAKLFSGG